MADSMEVHAEEVGQPTDELVVQDPDFDGETEETNAADTGTKRTLRAPLRLATDRIAPRKPHRKKSRSAAGQSSLRQRTLPKGKENLNLQTPGLRAVGRRWRPLAIPV